MNKIQNKFVIMKIIDLILVCNFYVTLDGISIVRMILIKIIQ